MRRSRVGVDSVGVGTGAWARGGGGVWLGTVDAGSQESKRAWRPGDASRRGLAGGAYHDRIRGKRSGLVGDGRWVGLAVKGPRGKMMVDWDR